MQPPRPLRGYDSGMFTFLPSSNRDDLGETPRKRKLNAYDRQIPMPSPSRGGRSGPKSYTSDFRDKELRNSFPSSPHRESSHPRDRNSFPASPHRESLHPRDYPRKSRSWDRKNYEESSCSNKRDRHDGIPKYTGYSSPRRESPHFRDLPRKNQSYDQKNYEESYRSNKRDRRESSSEYAGYSSPCRESSYSRDYPPKNRYCDQSYEESRHSYKRDHSETRPACTVYSSSTGQTQSPYHKDSSTASSVGQTHKSSTCPAYMTEDINKFKRHEFNEPKEKYNNSSHFQEFGNCGLQRPGQMEILPTSSHDQAPKPVEKLQNLHQVLNTGASVVDIHRRDLRAYKPSKWSPMITADNHLLNNESNTRVAKKHNDPDFQEFCNSRPQMPEQMNYMSTSSYDRSFKNPSEPQSLHQSFIVPQASSVCFDEKGLQTQKASNWPSTTEHFDRTESHQPSKEHFVSHFSEFQNCGPQKLPQINTVAPTSQETGGFQNSKQNLDAKCCSEETHRVGSSFNVKGSDQASTCTGYDNTKMSGDNVGTSECDLQSETNKLLQNALRLLSAASGIVSDNSSGKIQSQDEVKLMKLLLDSGIQNLQHSIVEATTSKNSESTPNADQFASNGENGFIKLDDQCEYDNKGSTFTEKLWEGTLQLSSSVSAVSAVAFFKSGEKMQDFSWSDAVVVKGKVRLEAFEKYVQDLPRSRTRGLMVMSFCCKEGSSDDWLKGMKEIARKYEDGKKVGFAQLSNGVDLYICPHSDAVITILAKHGFFKGMTAVIDKNDPLIGCVVWRKTLSSKTTEPNTLQSSTEQNLSIANENQEPVSYLSVTGGSKEEDKPPGFETDLEIEKSNLQPPTVVPENSGASSSSDNDDDLPEYDFGSVVSRNSGNQISDVGANDSGFAVETSKDNPVSAQTGSESSIISGELPDFQFQDLVSQRVGHQCESQTRILPIESQKPQSRKDSSLTLQKYKQTETCVAIPNSSAPFEDDDDDDDDDDIPEWCPPEVAQGVKPSFSSSNSEVPTSGFATPASSVNLPPLPPPPPRPQNNNYKQNRGAGPSFAPTLPTASGHLPPLPPTPPPAHLQFHNENYNYAPRVPTSQSSGFMHRGPSFRPSFTRNSASGSQFDPNSMDKPIYRPNWRGPSPRP